MAQFRQQDPKGHNLGLDIIVMIQSLNGDATRTVARKLTDVHSGFGIDGQLKSGQRIRGFFARGVDSLKDRIGFRDFFLGLVFCTLRKV